MTKSTPGDPVFIGGAPRSGSNVLAHLIARQSHYALIPQEVAFHCAHAGLAGFVRGEVDRSTVVEAARANWDPPGLRGARGLSGIVEREELESLLSSFEGEEIDDPIVAGGALVRSLLDPVARRDHKPSWVEKSQLNTIAARELLLLFPEARIIHIVRDGRDFACSAVGVPFGPDSVATALERWSRRLRDAERASRNVPSGRFLTLHLEDLVLLDREGAYARLLGFLGVPDEAAPREFFESEITAQRAHIGRAAAELPPAEWTELNEMYEAILAELHADGISCAPPKRSFEVAYAKRPGAPGHDFDPWSADEG